MLGATLLGLPLPLTPLQILWMNLVTDGLPAIALGMEPPSPGLMERPPRPPGEGVLGGGLGWQLLGRATAIGLSALAAFLWMLTAGHDLTVARTTAFTALVTAQLVYVFSARSERLDPLERPLGSNRWLVAAVALSGLAQLGALSLPFLQGALETVPLPPDGWLVVAVAAGWPALWDLARHAWEVGRGRSRRGERSGSGPQNGSREAIRTQDAQMCAIIPGRGERAGPAQHDRLRTGGRLGGGAVLG